MTTSSMPTSKLSTTSKSNIIIAGAGDLGLRLARRLTAHHSVIAVRRHFFYELSCDGRLRPLGPFKGDWHTLLQRFQPSAVFVTWAAGARTLEAYQRTYVDELSRLLHACSSLSSAPNIIASGSAAVFEAQDGRTIHEHSPMGKAQNPRNRILKQAEDLIQDYSHSRQRASCTLRLTGLYGPQRIPGLRRLKKSGHISEHPEGWINLLHIEDAATAMISAWQQHCRGNLFVNAQSIRRRDLYETAAKAFELALPRWSMDQHHRGRVVCAKKFLEETPWKPQHDDVEEWILNSSLARH